MSRVLACAALASSVVLASCGDPLALDGARADVAREVAADVDGARVLGSVVEIVDAHRADTPLACPEASEPVLCNLTHVRARDWLASRFQTLGYDVRRERGRDGAFEVENIVAVLAGRSRDVIVVGAHYDAGYAAADDDSTGVAAVLELARVLRGRRFERTIHFVGFDLEELGMVGSTLYARAHAPEVVAVFNLDSVGYAAPSQPTLPGIPLPSRGDFLAVVANTPSADRAAETRALAQTLDLGRVEAIVAPGDGTSALLGIYGVGSGDHAPFWAMGLPALMLTDTGPIRHPHYHSSGDNVARLTPTFLTASARIAAAAVAYAASEAP